MGIYEAFRNVIGGWRVDFMVDFMENSLNMDDLEVPPINLFEHIKHKFNAID